MPLEDLLRLLHDTQYKSESPTDFENVLAEAFTFLGFQAKAIGGKGDTDVLLTANIGQKSYKVDVDGKTSKNEKISDAQINWLSLGDHRKKNNSDFVVVVGPGFAGGNVEKRANEHGISLLTTDQLANILKAHAQYPVTLLELKDLFSAPGYLTSRVNDLLIQHNARVAFLESFKIIIEEIEKLQNSKLGYFTFESLAGREKIHEAEIEPDEIDNILRLLKLPFINAVTDIGDRKYVLALQKIDLSNIFFQISRRMMGTSLVDTGALIGQENGKSIPFADTSTEVPERATGTIYYSWIIKGSSIIALARPNDPYKHFCPLDHSKTIIGKVVEAFQHQNVINFDTVYQSLENKELAPLRLFKGAAEEYKIRVILGVLELEGLIKWTGSKRPIEYTLGKSITDLVAFSENIAHLQEDMR